jgi:general secretion pathway protein A
MYANYFGCHEPPFSLSPDPRFFYSNATYEDAYKRILTAIRERKGLIVLTGELGTGKTTLLHLIANSFEDNTHVIFFQDSVPTFEVLLTTLCRRFSLPVDHDDPSTQSSEIHAYLRSLAYRGGTAVLLFDNAQKFAQDDLDRLHLLLTLADSQGKLLQVILAGDPELETTLARPEFRRIQRQIAAQCQLTPLSADEVASFIYHRLRAAGRERQDLFAPEAIRSIARYSHALPWRISVLCDGALMAAYAADQKIVLAETIEQIAHNLQWESKPEVFLEKQGRAARSAMLPAQQRHSFVIPQPWLPAPHWSQQQTRVGKGMIIAGVFSLLVFAILSAFKQQSTFQEGSVFSLIVSKTQAAFSSWWKRFLTEPEVLSTATAFSLVPAETPQNQLLEQQDTRRAARTEQPSQAKPYVLSPAGRKRVRQVPRNPVTNRKGLAKQTFGAQQRQQRDAARTQLGQLGVPVNRQTFLDSVEQGQLRIADLLLSSGISPNTRDQQGSTALMVAVHKDLPDMVHTLLGHGAEVNARDRAGKTALIHAASQGNPRMVETLLKKGADANLKDKRGWTAFMYTTQQKKSLTVLLPATHEPITPARVEDYQTVAELLQRREGASE